MSLLLDALKRAEQEKNARQQGGEAAPGATRASPGGAKLELQPIAPNGTARAANDKTSSGTPPPAFIAPAPAAKSKRGLWIAGGVIAIVAALGAGYVAYSVSSLAPRGAASAYRPAPLPASVAAKTPAAASAPIEAKREPEPSANRAPTLAAVSVAAAAPTETPASAPRPRPRAAESIAPAASSAVQLERTREAKRIDPDLAAGYEALRRGNTEAARRGYDAALARDGTSLDALLGLATLEARAGNRGAAAQRYRRVLELDSRNPTAIAGLAALADLSRPDALEAELAADIGRQPENASLHFTLGSLYASQGRWTQAQSAFFEAHRLDPANGDIAYNLAVSLDHLGQPRLAANFYRRALDEAKTQPTQFDPASAARRLAELEGGR